VVLGRIDPARFAGGKIVLDAGLAATAISQGIGDAAGMGVEEAARGITEIVDENMASAARVHAVENGKDTTGRTLIAFGGAAPLHAVRLARKLGIDRVVVPRDAGVGSAHGFLDAPIAYEVVRTVLVRLDQLNEAGIDTLFAEMRAEAEAVVRFGIPAGDLVETRCAFMRYRGQGHEIAVSLSGAGLNPAAMRAAFDETYTRLFGRVIPRLEVEALTWTLALSQPFALPTQEPVPPATGFAPPNGTCRLVESATGEVVEASVFTRTDLLPGMRLHGPAAIVEDGTTTIVPGDCTAWIGHSGEIVIEGDVP
jgi:N-methylhydantoinase A